MLLQLRDLVLQGSRPRLLLLSVLADGLPVAKGALLRRVLLRRISGTVGGGGKDLGVDMKAGMRMRHVGPRRVACVGVGAGMGVLQDLIEEAVHGAAAWGLLRIIQTRECLLIRDLNLPIIHGWTRAKGLGQPTRGATSEEGLRLWYRILMPSLAATRRTPPQRRRSARKNLAGKMIPGEPGRKKISHNWMERGRRWLYGWLFVDVSSDMKHLTLYPVKIKYSFFLHPNTLLYRILA